MANYNIFLGYSAGSGMSDGNGENVVIGKNAGKDANNVFLSTFIGSYAGYNATNALGSVFIGASSGASSTLATSSLFFGSFAGMIAPNASSSIFIGNNAGAYATSANNSTFIGTFAGSRAERASSSIFIGDNSGINATYGGNSIFIGDSSGSGATYSSGSIFIGKGSGQNATDSTRALFIGTDAGRNATVDNRFEESATSIAIGQYATPRSFSQSIAIGYSAINTATKQLNIGNVLWVEGINTSIIDYLNTTTHPDTIINAKGRINGAWEINKSHYTSVLSQSGTAIVDKVTGTDITVDLNKTYSMEFDIVHTNINGTTNIWKTYAVVQNIANIVTPIGKIRVMTDTGITSYEWYVDGLLGQDIYAEDTWEEDPSVFLKFNVNTTDTKINITSSVSNTVVDCGSVRITKTIAAISESYYY